MKNRILIVETDVKNRESLKQELSRITLDLAATGQEALSLLKDKEDYDAIFIDKDIQGEFGGVETMRRIKAGHPTVRVIMMIDNPKLGHEVLIDGACRYIYNKASNQEIRLLIDRVLETRMLERMLFEEESVIDANISIAGKVVLGSKDQLLEEIAKQAIRLFDVCACVVWEADKDSSTLKISACAGNVDNEFKKNRLDIKDSCKKEYLLQKRKPIAIKNVHEDTHYQYKEHARNNGWVSLLSAPMFLQNRTIGMIDIYSKHERWFVLWEKGLLSQFAWHAALEIGQADLAMHSRKISRLGTSGNHKELVEYIVEAVHDLTKLPVILWEMSDKQGESKSVLKIAAARRVPEDYIEKARTSIESGKSMTSIALDKKEHIQVSDIQDKTIDPPFENIEQAKIEGWRAFLCVPLLGKHDRPLGTLSIYDKKVRNFSESEVALCTSFAGYAAIAFENFQMLDKERNTREILESLQQIRSDILAQSEPQELFKTIVNSACSLMEKKNKRNLHGSVCLCDHAAKKIRVAHSNSKKMSGRTLKFGEGMAGWVVKNQRPEFVPDYFEWEGRAPSFKSFNKLFASIIGVPLIWENMVIGVLILSSKEIGIFNNDDMELLMRFSETAAIALQNAQLYSGIETNTNRLLAMHGSGERTEVLKIIAKSAIEILMADIIVIYEYYKGRDKEFPNSPVSIEKLHDPDFQAIKTEDSVVSGAVKLEEPLYMEDALKGNDCLIPKTDQYSVDMKNKKQRFVSREKVKSSAILPLRVNNEVVGVMFVSYKQKTRFTESLKAVIELFANQAALAIQTSRTLGQIAALNDIQKAITQVMDPDEVLKLILEKALDLIGFSKGWIRLYNPDNGFLEVKACQGLASEHAEKLKEIKRHPEEGITGHVFETGEPVVVSDVEKEKRYKMLFKDTVSELCVPMVFKNMPTGIINIESKRLDAFNEQDKKMLSSFAAQAAIAIENARSFRSAVSEVQRSANVFEALYDSGQAMTASLDINDVFKELLKQTQRLLKNSPEEELCCGCFMKREGDILELIDGFPKDLVDNFKKRVGARIDLKKGIDGRIGTGGRAVLEGKSELVPDVSSNNDFYPVVQYMAGSSLSVPIMSKGKAIGVISVDHCNKNAFDKVDKKDLEALAAQAGIAIQNAQNYEGLKKIKGLIGSKTAVEWIKMVSTSWGHNIRREVGTGLARLELLKMSLKKGKNSDDVKEEMSQLKNALNRIKDIPITAPLSAQVESISINGIIQTYLKRLIDRMPYKLIDLRFIPDKNIDRLTVRVNPEWLKQALEILLQNSARAMQDIDPAIKKIRVKTRVKGQIVEISVSDTGPGIQPHIMDRILKKTIPKEKGSRGSGIGLLLAQSICQTFQGDIRLKSSDNSGTEIVISLPIEK